MGRLGTVVYLMVLMGCSPTVTGLTSDTVTHALEERFPHETPTTTPIIPEQFTREKPLHEDHAVLLALWNNPSFQEALVDLHLTRADLLQAGLLPNPEVVYYFHVTDKPFKYLVEFPIEALWLRPLRLRAAAAENARAAERVTQLGLDLIRDTRQAWVDVSLASERFRVASEAMSLRSRIASFAEKRFQAGDASQQDATLARIDALQAQQDLVRLQTDITVTEERLKNLMGLASMTTPLVLASPTITKADKIELEALVADAVESRPDVHAAHQAVEAAAERLRLARTGWFRFLGIYDATSGTNGHEPGPAFRVTVPLFHWNQGGIARAEAEVEQLTHRRDAVRNQVMTDVRQAAVRFTQAEAELVSLRTKVMPEVQAAIKRAERTAEAGNAPYLLVLETTRQLVDTYNREVQLVADRHRAWAELERAVGRKLAAPPSASTPREQSPVVP